MSQHTPLPASQRAAVAWLAATTPPPEEDSEHCGGTPTEQVFIPYRGHDAPAADRLSEDSSSDVGAWAAAPRGSSWTREAPEEPSSAPTGPAAPHRLVPSPLLELCLPQRSAGTRADLWWLGAHGGAGESTLAALLPGSRPAEHVWPGPGEGPARVVLVARTGAHGLLRAQAAMTQWASGTVEDVELLGLVLIPDVPGHLPPALRALAKAICGGAPRVWHLPWSEELRRGADPTSSPHPRATRRLLAGVTALLPPAPSPATEEVPHASRTAAHV